MALERAYTIKCDNCGKLHGPIMPVHQSPRHARAAAKRDGWARRKVVVGQDWYLDADEPSGRHYYDDVRGRDYCPKCLAAQDTPDALAAHWPSLSDMPDGVDIFADRYPVTGGDE